MTDADRELVRSIQERCGADQTGEIDTATLLAIDETLAIARKLFIDKFVPKPDGHHGLDVAVSERDKILGRVRQ